jgi:hypothetical protein
MVALGFTPPCWHHHVKPPLLGYSCTRCASKSTPLGMAPSWMMCSWMGPKVWNRADRESAAIRPSDHRLKSNMSRPFAAAEGNQPQRTLRTEFEERVHGAISFKFRLLKTILSCSDKRCGICHTAKFVGGDRALSFRNAPPSRTGLLFRAFTDATPGEGNGAILSQSGSILSCRHRNLRRPSTGFPGANSATL